MANAAIAAPEGYMMDAQGRLVPQEMVKEIDKLRDQTVRRIVTAALITAAAVRSFKEAAVSDIKAFTALSAEEYEATLGGVKGNITLRSYDGKYKVCRDIAENLVFDERLQVAKALIDECINSWAEGSDAKIRTLILDSFQVDKQGRVNTKRILSLRRLNIDDPTWKRAMEAIGESIQVAGSKAYIRIYERQEDGGYQLINLDLASL
jgi:hypothetical protein